MLVLGIDPAIGRKAEWGMAIYDSDLAVLVWHRYCAIPDEPSLTIRLAALCKELTSCLTEPGWFHIDAIAIEQAYVGVNPATSLKLGMAVGALCATAISQLGPENVYLIFPSEAKVAFASDTHASKSLMMWAAQQRFGCKLGEHVTDAAAMAVTLAGKLRMEEMINEPTTDQGGL